MRQIIIVRKDLKMSPGKLSAQVAHASMAFFTHMLKIADKAKWNHKYRMVLNLDEDLYDEWMCGIFTKTICEAKNAYQLLKCVKIAENLGLQEGVDFFLIKDACLTELKPEETDEKGQGRVLTCIGFRPLPDEIAHKISKKYQLYR